ncbi:MAG: SEC-C domain-containing protein [Lachnospiraceae bacterium]|nr:SEC-C domain-containing protein [Lachnospiraceae bacterium]
MALIDNWHEIAYDTTDQNEMKKVWEKYFKEEKEIYKKLLSDVNKEVVGTVENLANEYGMDITYFIGFLEGINESIEKPNPIEKLKESSKVKIKIKPEDLYYNMVKAKASWLYELTEWDNILSKEKRDELYRKCKDSLIIKRDGDKVYPNDPCPCGSGKKYKKCCGKNA